MDPMETMTTLLPIIAGVIVPPVVFLFKRLSVWISKDNADLIPPRTVTAVLAVAITYGLNAWLQAGMSLGEVVTFALTIVGTSVLVHGGSRSVTKRIITK